MKGSPRAPLLTDRPIDNKFPGGRKFEIPAENTEQPIPISAVTVYSRPDMADPYTDPNKAAKKAI